MFDAEDILMSLKISTQQDSIYCALVKKILPEKNPDHKLTVIPINRKITYPYFQQSESDILPSSELLLQYMDEIIDSTNARKEKNVFSEAYQLFSKDFLLGIKKYNEQGCIDYQADPDNNEILEIICKDTEARAVWLLCKVMKTICLITSESKEEYYKQLQSMHFNDKHLRAICCYYKELNA